MNDSSFLTRLGGTLKGCAKIALLARHATLRPVHDSRPLLVMGNGPSLRKVLDTRPPFLKEAALMAVNFAANAPEFTWLKPEYYVIADGFFFSDVHGHENLEHLYKAFSEVDWSMTLIVPVRYGKHLPSAVTDNRNIRIATFNDVGVEGFGAFERLVYSARMAMPRPRNVLITALTAAIWMGYTEIYVTGADHSWMKTIAVDGDNHVISVQPHFYKDSSTEQKRVDTEYAGYHLHDIIMSFYIAFRSYHRIEEWAVKKGVNIYNTTPESFIDAFRRRPLPGCQE